MAYKTKGYRRHFWVYDKPVHDDAGPRIGYQVSRSNVFLTVSQSKAYNKTFVCITDGKQFGWIEVTSLSVLVW
jgi:hypothetical protein